MMLPTPWAYIDWTVPENPSDADTGHTPQSDTHTSYIHWLADYLFYTDIR